MPTTRPRTLRDSVKRAIERRGLPLAEIARKSGIGRTELSFFVNGQRGLRTDKLDRLMGVLGLRVVARKKKTV